MGKTLKSIYKINDNNLVNYQCFCFEPPPKKNNRNVMKQNTAAVLSSSMVPRCIRQAAFIFLVYDWQVDINSTPTVWFPLELLAVAHQNVLLSPDRDQVTTQDMKHPVDVWVPTNWRFWSPAQATAVLQCRDLKANDWKSVILRTPLFINLYYTSLFRELFP